MTWFLIDAEKLEARYERENKRREQISSYIEDFEEIQ